MALLLINEKKFFAENLLLKAMFSLTKKPLRAFYSAKHVLVLHHIPLFLSFSSSTRHHDSQHLKR